MALPLLTSRYGWTILSFVVVTSRRSIISKKVLCSRFKITECGPLGWFLSMYVVQAAHEVIVDQPVYVKSVLRKYGMEDCRPAKTPDI